jgi:hypothetical protein
MVETYRRPAGWATSGSCGWIPRTPSSTEEVYSCAEDSSTLNLGTCVVEGIIYSKVLARVFFFGVANGCQDIFQDTHG